VRILAISGSLRAASSNTVLLVATKALAPEGTEVLLYDRIGELPHFNPDLDGDPPLLPVADLRAHLQACDGVLISSPEYAHGVPGVLKNALDWVVGSGELVEKPVALINASPRSTHAQASLAEILTVMNSSLITEACRAVPLSGRKIDVAGIVGDSEISGVLREALSALTRAIESRGTEPIS
jgi:chromate reductase